MCLTRLRPARCASSRFRLVVICTLAIAASVVAFPVAHHAFTAEFDAERKVTLKGTVVIMEWVNPHAWLTIAVKGKSGQSEQWSLEFGPPNQLFRRGWRKTSLMPGTEVTATAYLAKDGRRVANAEVVTLPDGRQLGAAATGSGADPERPSPKAKP